jgi:hypothetical protein
LNPVAEILWEASADVEQHGVVRFPIVSFGTGKETCATFAIADARKSFHHGLDARRVLLMATGAFWSVGEILSVAVAQWNDAQPSRAVVAAAMRDAAQLAEWAGSHLLGGSK